jgi:hypothetical protein
MYTGQTGNTFRTDTISHNEVEVCQGTHSKYKAKLSHTHTHTGIMTTADNVTL